MNASSYTPVQWLSMYSLYISRDGEFDSCLWLRRDDFNNNDLFIPVIRNSVDKDDEIYVQILFYPKYGEGPEPAALDFGSVSHRTSTVYISVASCPVHALRNGTFDFAVLYSISLH